MPDCSNQLVAVFGGHFRLNRGVVEFPFATYALVAGCLFTMCLYFFSHYKCKYQQIDKWLILANDVGPLVNEPLPSPRVVVNNHKE